MPLDITESGEGIFIRDTSIALTVDSNNIGAINMGTFTKRFFPAASYTYGGNETAVFSTYAQGIAALMELILSHYNDRSPITIHEYICGGGNMPPSRSYSGGQANYAQTYTANMQSRRPDINFDDKLDGSIDQLIMLVEGHAFAESGLKARYPTEAEYQQAVMLLKAYSKNLAKSEIKDLQVHFV